MNIAQNVSLKDKNWFQTGGNAKYFCTPQNAEDFKTALKSAQTNNWDIFILGKGANILISDEGFNGLVIHPQLDDIKIIDTDIIEAGAGVSIENLINFALDNNLCGLEEFSGIPGTVGGSVFINIHYFTHFLSDYLIEAQIINKETQEILTVNKSWFNFGYDTSKLHEKNYYLLSAKFKLKKVPPLEAAYTKGKRDERISQRNWRFPTSHTCGSFFRNFHLDEIKFKINGNKITAIAYYLDKLGIKGVLNDGDAIVSHKHANMIVNTGNATSKNIINLAKKMQTLTFDQFGITPKTECQFIGFKDSELLI